MNQAVTVTTSNLFGNVHGIPYQDASLDIWNTKYRLKGINDEVVDMTLEDTYVRVAEALASQECNKKLRKEMKEKFLFALRNGAVPAGRIMSNAGAGKHRPAVSTINCTVSGIIRDSMESILEMNKEAGMTLKAGCGIGYEFSTLRPKGAYVAGAGAATSGPLSFMDIFDSTCFTVSSAGGRRGAQMGTFDVGHPDVEDFIGAKREDGRLRQFNLSLLITEGFMEAVKNGSDWPLAFPTDAKEVERLGLNLDNSEQILWREWPIVEDRYISNDEGLIACYIYKTVKAERLWNRIMSSTYDYAEPGFILIDKVNEMNNNWYCETIRTTNPCGEQPLPAYGSCLLGSVNLTQFVKNPFTDEAEFDWKLFKKVVGIFSRMLDNVVEMHGLALEGQAKEIVDKRRHGMGYLGLGSVLTMLKVKYGSEESLDFTEQVTKELALEGWRQALNLAKEKGAAPIMDRAFVVTKDMLRKRPEMIQDGYKEGDKIKGSVLMIKYGRYMQKIVAELGQEFAEEAMEVGLRYTHHSSIAPTGTISLSLGNNASNGIEPSFAHSYSRNIIREGKKTKEKVNVYSYEMLAYRSLVNPNADAYGEGENALPEYFLTADSITPKQHVDVQAAAQKWVDSSISKTANVPTDFAFDDFKDIYMYAYEQGLKGCTTFRFNPEVFQGVLVKDEDLKNTTYTFTLEDGSTVEFQGDEQVEYDGEIHTAANLYDALKEGYYGRF